MQKSQQNTTYKNFSESKIHSIEENTSHTTHIRTCLDPDGPQPIILMSLGRSGSGSTWQVMSTLTGKKATPSHELTGSNSAASTKFFQKAATFDQTNGGGSWLVSYLCSAQRRWPKAGVVGFKWKPYKSISMPAAIDALKLISTLDNPSIKVVRSRRNLLDVLISRQKHHTNKKLSAHCATGDEKCRWKHLKLGRNMVLDGEHILQALQDLKKQEDAVDQMLDDFGIPHVDVSFEKLYLAENADEWNRILYFLDVGSTQVVTREAVNKIMGHASTSHLSHNIAIKNYEEIVNVFNGTGFEHLLHRKLLT